MSIHLLPAQPAHRPALETFLQAAGLPTSDLPADLSGFVLAFEGDTLVGSAGIEDLGGVALLRSVAVDPAYRNRQLAEQLQAQALERAAARGLREAFLITTSADRYFERHGFTRIDRAAAPAALRSTGQFASLCPSSAVVMRKPL